MLRKFMTAGIAMSALQLAWSQDSTKASQFSVTGGADVYYKYDLGESKFNNLTSFTSSHNTFELGMASLKLNYKTPKVELVADLGLGKRAQEFSYNDDGILTAVKQLYMSYTPADWVKLTAGSWATHIGYELVDPQLNRNYSMSYMFTNGPFFHTGVKAEAFYNSSSFMIGIANPTDFKYVPDGVINKKFLLAQYSYAPSDYFKAYINYVGGQAIDTSKSKQLDLVITSKLSGKFSLAVNGTLNRTTAYLGNKTYAGAANWWGTAVYLNYDPSGFFGLTLREEYFNDDNGLKMFSGTPGGGSILATTLSASFKVDNFIFIPEFRVDNTSSSIFSAKDNKATKTAANVLLAAIYQF